MRIFTNWQFTTTYSYGIPTYDVFSDCGTDWYRLSAELEVRPEKWVVGLNTDGTVVWFTDGSVYELHAPFHEGHVIVCDDFNPEWGHDAKWDFEGNAWVHLEHKPTVRTKEDIQRDLESLLEELKSHK